MYFRQDDPRLVMPTTRRSRFGGSTAIAAPSTAPAACDSDDRQTEFNPYSPPAHKIIWMSGDKRSAGISAEKETVDTTYFGTPSGSA